MKHIARRWIPQNATAIERHDLKVVVYLYTNSSNANCAVAYRGNAGKPTFNYAYGSEESREIAINKWFAGLERDAEVKTAYREAKKHIHCALTIGQIVYTTWGYDQTNVDFYEVVGLKGTKTAVLRKIKSEITEHGLQSMSGYAVPIPGDYCEEAFNARAISSTQLKVGSRRITYLWDGRPVGCSWYA